MITVLCHGCFDVLHIGHINYLKAAKKYGDRLLVSVTTDRYVNKGPGRPHFSATERVKMLAALRLVDEVILSDHPTAVPVIREYRPDYYVKGPDYANREDDPTGQIYAEEQAVKEYGGQIVFTDTPQYSSSALINAEFRDWTLPQRHCIEQVRAAGGMSAIKEALERVSKLRATVAGECIWDVYRYVTPQGLSSKSPSLSVRFEDQRESMGGAWAIAAHVREFCSVTQVKSGVEHTKTRYIDAQTGQRLFEVCEHPEERTVTVRDEGDLLIAADFGHGYWDAQRNRTSGWYALNVQTNSSNAGFNLIGSWGASNYLVCDRRELQLQVQSRTLDVPELIDNATIPAIELSVTMGPHGALFKSSRNINYTAPAFADTVIDAIGAGDAYFALTSLLVYVETSPVLIPFLGNVFAGLKTRIVGNEHAVSKASLLKACEAILK